MLVFAYFSCCRVYIQIHPHFLHHVCLRKLLKSPEALRILLQGVYQLCVVLILLLTFILNGCCSRLFLCTPLFIQTVGIRWCVTLLYIVH